MPVQTAADTARIERLVEALKRESHEAGAVFDSGIWYAPRSLWTAGVLDVAGGLAPVPSSYETVEVQLDRSKLRNPGRHPIQINRLALSIIGNPFAQSTEVDMPQGAAGYHNTMSALNDIRARVSVPFRQYYARNMPTVSSISPQPVGQPPVQRNGAGFENASSLWGLSHLMFDRPLYIGKQTGLEWGLSSAMALRWPGGPDINIPDVPDALLPVTMSWLEEGGLFAGSARSRRVDLRFDSSLGRLRLAAALTREDKQKLVDSGQPIPLPGGFVAPAYVGAQDIPFWDPASSYPPNMFKRQSPVRSGAAKILGMTMAIDQITLDDIATVSMTQTKMAQYSSMLGMRNRLSGGVDSTWWARQGIPTNLFMDTITNAAVYELDVPLTLVPGDSVNITIQVPGEAFASAGVAAGRYNIGVALNGFAAIEG